MYIDQYTICKAEEICKNGRIEVIGNGGLIRTPHFDLVGDGMHCCIPLRQAGFMYNGSCNQKTLSLEERKILQKILLEQRSDWKFNNWQFCCYIWNIVEPSNPDQIESDFYFDISNMPDYTKANRFIDNGFTTKIKDDGDYKYRR